MCKNLVWGNGHIQVVSGSTRGDALLDIYLLRPESSFVSCNIVPRISDHKGAFLDEICREPKVERIVPVYQNRSFRLPSISSGKV